MDAVLARMAERHGCRAFDGNAIDPDEVDAIIQDGLAAPSSCNQQNWHFVVIGDPALKRRAAAIAGGNPHFLDCAVIIYLCFQKGWTHDKFSIVQSVAGACDHMILSAHLRGYESIWNAGIGDTAEIARMLGIPPIIEVQGALCLGYAKPDAPAIKPPRRALESVRSWNCFARPASSIYPVQPCSRYPYFAISNARNPFAVWDPKVWGWERLADFRGYSVWNKSPLAGVHRRADDGPSMEAEVADLPALAPGQHLLELMPWGGTYSVMLRRRYGPEVHLHLAELSPHNHTFIMERLRQEGSAVANLHCELMSEGRLPCADGTIDVAFLPRVLEQVPEPWRLLDEVARVLRSGGLVLVSARNLWSWHGYAYVRVRSRAQVRNAGPVRPLPAVAVRRALQRRFQLTQEFGLVNAGKAGVRRIDGVARYVAPLFVAHAIKT